MKLILVVGLSGSGKTTYVKQRLKNGVAYDLDAISAALRLRGPHEEYHEGAREITNALMYAIVEKCYESKSLGGDIFVIRTAPSEDEIRRLRPKKIVLCEGQYSTSDRAETYRGPYTKQQTRLRQLEFLARAFGIEYEVVGRAQEPGPLIM